MKSIKYILSTAALLMAFNTLHADELAADVVKPINPYVRAVPTDATNTAAFMTLQNTGKFDHHLVAAFTPAAKQIQLHVTFMEKGQSEFSMMRMRQVHDFVIKAGKSESFKPGAHHIMLMGLTQKLNLGDTVPVTLLFSDGSYEQVNAIVKTVDA